MYRVLPKYGLVVVFALAGLLVLGAGTNAAGPRAAPANPHAILALPAGSSPDACKDAQIPANDDGSSAQITLPFTVNFFGQTYHSLYVNNNGNITFDSALSAYTPFGLLDAHRAIIAPFFADADTRGTGSQQTSYSPTGTTYSGRPAFCADWVNIGYYGQHTDKLNSFQLILVDRADTGANNFDIIMNYDQVQWETGDASGGVGGIGGTSARVGYSNGQDSAFELPGSAVSRSFLDSNTTTGLIYGSRNTLQLGRYIYPVRNGGVPTGGSITGGVYRTVISPTNAINGALVQVCPMSGTGCVTTNTGAGGQYLVTGLPAGEYRLTAFPPGSINMAPAGIGPVTIVSGQELEDQNILLTAQILPPSNVTIDNIGVGGGMPHLYWLSASTLKAIGCAGGSASYQILQNGTVVRSGAMSEGPSGTYTAVIPALHPLHGYARVVITIHCPDNSTQVIPFDIYIDPSGFVRTVSGDPIAGAKVTLYRADSASGPFVVVPNGSAVMSLANRLNPALTDAAGHFGWDVVAGYYKVRAERVRCTAPSVPGQGYVESDVLTIPPAVTDLDMRLSCTGKFTDVAPTDYFYTPVEYLASHNIIAGYADGTFRPYANTTRGQLAKIMVSARGWAIDTTGGPHFGDVPASHPFYPFIETAYHHNIISGYGDGTFRWGSNVTRGQIAKIIVSAMGWEIDTTGGPHFGDVPASNPFYPFVETAYDHAVISGYGDGTFRWGANATRGQIAKIVYNALGSPPLRVDPVLAPPVQATAPPVKGAPKPTAIPKP